MNGKPPEWDELRALRALVGDLLHNEDELARIARETVAFEHPNYTEFLVGSITDPDAGVLYIPH